MVQVGSASIEGRILRILLSKYPIDDIEVSKLMGLDLRETQRHLRGMEARGWLTIEPLPDRWFIRMKRSDFTFIGREETQRKAVKHKRRDRRKDRVKTKLLVDDQDDMMYA